MIQIPGECKIEMSMMPISLKIRFESKEHGRSGPTIMSMTGLELELGLNEVVPARRAAQSTAPSVRLPSCPRAGARSAAPRTRVVCG